MLFTCLTRALSRGICRIWQAPCACVRSLFLRPFCIFSLKVVADGTTIKILIISGATLAIERHCEMRRDERRSRASLRHRLERARALVRNVSSSRTLTSILPNTICVPYFTCFRDDIDLVFIDKRDVTSGFPSLFNSPLSSDLRVSIGSQSEIFYGHSIILASRSQELRKLIETERNSRPEANPLVLRVDGVPEDLFLSLVRNHD